MDLPRYVTLREVSPRDGLQGEPTPISSRDKIRLIELLSEAGFPRINVTSFVSPKAMPQMADADEVVAALPAERPAIYDATVPNERGVERAIQAKVDAITVFVSASEQGSLNNVGRSTEESMAQAERAIVMAREAGIGAIGTVSKAFGSPYGEDVTSERVVALAERFVAAGATGIALGDTSGEANPRQVHDLVRVLLRALPAVDLSLHMHDTRGLALTNILAAMDAGATHFDGAVGGIGGSPYTKNSAGNAATEDLIFMCHAMGIETGVDLGMVLRAHDFLADLLGRELPGKLGKISPRMDGATR